MKKTIIINPPEGPGDVQTLIAVMAPVVARLCAKPADVLELPKKPRKSKR